MLLCVCMLRCSVLFNYLRSCGLESTRLFCPRNFPGKNTGVGCHFLLQGIFPTQGWNPHFFASPKPAGGFLTIAPPGKPFPLLTTDQKLSYGWGKSCSLKKACFNGKQTSAPGSWQGMNGPDWCSAWKRRGSRTWLHTGPGEAVEGGQSCEEGG